MTRAKIYLNKAATAIIDSMKTELKRRRGTHAPPPSDSEAIEELARKAGMW